MVDIAVVGLDCRFPKAGDPAALWKLLLDGADGIDEIPAHRWNAADLHDDGTINHRTGGLISDADAFDNDFFGITPREAEAMDPQQRLLLQTAWRAMENATLDPRGQAGSNTGVFVGVMANEWAHLHLRDYREITAQAGSGNGYFMTANRLSYQLDLRGPSLAVDTACSSSLVAVHLAAQALRNGECDQAVAAGVNLTLTPAVNVFYTKAGLAAPDGRCKPFSGSADGIGRGEGVAVVVLRRLEDAVDAGLPIYAVIKGSAVNSDGRSNGITAPNRWAQQQVATTAYRAAGIVPAQISFLEAHGTGTLLGDMIEAKALADAHRLRRDEPCAIGSIKGNLGHTEGAAGIAGLIKIALSLHHRVVPASRFAETENAQLRLAAGGLRLLAEPMELPAGTVYAGVSSFGIGGTNCHVVLASVAAAEPAPTATGDGVLTLSADTLEGLRRNALQLAGDIENSDAPLAQLCWSTNRVKASGRTRLAVVTRDRAEAIAALRGDLEPGTAAGTSTGWLFSGQGTQYPGMAAALYDSSDVFRDAFDEVDAAILPHLGEVIVIAHRKAAPLSPQSVAARQLSALVEIVRRTDSRRLASSVTQLTKGNRAAVDFGIVTSTAAGMDVYLRGAITVALDDGVGRTLLHGAAAPLVMHRSVRTPAVAAVVTVDEGGARPPTRAHRTGVYTIAAGTVPGQGAVIWATQAASRTPRTPAVATPDGSDMLSTASTVQIGRPLGCIILDDNSRFEIDRDCVIGRAPHDSDAVRRGLRPIRIEHRTGGMSRAHAEIRRVKRDVFIVDRGSTNGVFLCEPGRQAWTRLAPWEPVIWLPGASVRIGNRILCRQPPTEQRPPRGNPAVRYHHGPQVDRARAGSIAACPR